MGRWVTSKGRRVYIPDEGEENPYDKKQQTSFGKEMDEKIQNYRDKFLKNADDKRLEDIKANLEKSTSIVGTTEQDHVALAAIEREQAARKAGLSKSINKDLDDKEKQIAQSKTEADKLNGKEKPAAKKSSRPSVQKLAGLERRKNNLLAKGRSMFSQDPNQWLLYGEKGKEMYHQYKEALDNYKWALKQYQK